MCKYRKKPTHVDFIHAVQWDGNLETLLPLLTRVRNGNYKKTSYDKDLILWCAGDPTKGSEPVTTQRVTPGDWVCVDTMATLFTVPDFMFRQMWDPVVEEKTDDAK